MSSDWTSADHDLCNFLNVDAETLLGDGQDQLWLQKDPETDDNLCAPHVAGYDLDFCRRALRLLRSLADATVTGRLTRRGDSDVHGLTLRGWSREDVDLLDEIINLRVRFAIDRTLLYAGNPPGDRILRKVVIMGTGRSAVERLADAAFHLLRMVLEDRLRLIKCVGPAHNEAGGLCGRFFIAPVRRGAPPNFCSKQCGDRHRRDYQRAYQRDERASLRN